MIVFINVILLDPNHHQSSPRCLLNKLSDRGHFIGPYFGLHSWPAFLLIILILLREMEVTNSGW